MSDLTGDCIYKTPFEVIWKENDSWGESWASRQFKKLKEAEAFFEVLAERDDYRVWLGEIGKYSDHGITREAYFYFKAHQLGAEYESIADQLGKRTLGLMWFNDQESEDQDGNFALISYVPIAKQEG